MKVILRQDNNKNFIAYNENDKIIGYVINTKNISKGMGNIEMIIELNNVKSIFSGDVQLVKSNLVPNDEMWFIDGSKTIKFKINGDKIEQISDSE